ncbi:hypothetical protein SAMN02745134_02924 [Clostridium acidisoli DSM 12555]|uniref:Uncharacterized protein n=1 Tax=Clostridium acidisoli DSM 12555 TaxID=1121291 RepID=A0A1W1XSB7_9CLOT|nr:hypothetical protein [Clostridium acidisoli]SMC26745.1 hypothetical protein SAMN02745134_02924 [Clostridium acidisoli DSM 12555]
MKYFTDELWCGINSESEKERENASSKWEKILINIVKYLKT